jgi:hypothetical protein
VFTEIRALDAEPSRYFHEELGLLNGYVGTERLLFDLLFEEAARRNKSFLDLDDDDSSVSRHACAVCPG